ncbi:MAG: sugar phosphate isomerase/epimerase [Planctomycetota bacterium]|nr:sugar phosphate isomerase/epimerase [Planctomycetota bacterium]
MTSPLNRRDLLAGTGIAVATALLTQRSEAGEPTAAATAQPAAEPFRYCLNTSTIRGQKLSIVEEVEIAAQAGYQAIEPWIGELDDYAKKGGSLPDLQKRIADAGLTVEDAIGFPTWIVDDEARRRQGLEAAKRDMDLVRQIGGKRIAAPPVGATDRVDLNLLAAAERYRALLELGREMGLVPQLELWGFSKSMSHLSEVLLVAMESRDPDACVLPDIFHMYKGGSDFGGLRFIHGQAIHVFHVNDYPDQVSPADVTDAQRVFPGDGVAPLTQIFRALREIGFRGVLSLELFNREYWKQDPFQVAKTGLEKMRTAVQKALS